MAVIKRYQDEIVKSSQDSRLYRHLTLSNGMKVLLISDSTTDKSAASLDVHVGSMSDPKDYPGLAHFCEHMLFLGTEKYPCENQYNTYLSENSGSSNAYTALDHTNYQFDVSPTGFKGALDRFAQFFLCPLFTESCVEREVNAVNSENEKNLQSDQWRLMQLDRSTTREGHDFSKFGTGNKLTLYDESKARGENVRDALIEFHKKWYSANIMSLVILSKETLDELEELAISLFKYVENKQVEVPLWLDHPYGEEQLKQFCYVTPVKEMRALNITFPTPDFSDLYLRAPDIYLGHLIGHEGKGSLLSLLKQRGWVNDLLAGGKQGARGFAFFIINFYLSEEGILHVDEIVESTFHYLHMLEKEGPKKWIFEELSLTSRTNFTFRDKQRPFDFVTSLSDSLHHLKPEDCISSGVTSLQFDEGLINSVLTSLKPGNCRMALISPHCAEKATLKEKWYGTKYHVEQITQEKLDRWNNCGTHCDLHLSLPNEFIPHNLSLCTNDEEVREFPTKLLTSPLLNLWYKQDRHYNLPKNILIARLHSPVCNRDPHSVNMLYLFSGLIRDSLNEYAYPAELAGLNYSVSCSRGGLDIEISGYYDKQPQLLRKIMEVLVNLDINQQRFDIIKETHLRGLRNFKKDQSYSHVIYYIGVLMTDQGWTKEQLLQRAEESLSIDDLKAFIPEYLGRLNVDVLIHGAVSEQWAKDTSDVLTKSLVEGPHPTKPLMNGQKIKPREVQLPKGKDLEYITFNEIHGDSALLFLMQTGIYDIRESCLMDIVEQIMQEPTFHFLRTVEQLGYIVWSGVRRIHNTQSLRIIIQSSKHPEFLEERIEVLMSYVSHVMKYISDKAFDVHKQAIINRKLEKPKKLATQTSMWWSEISTNQLNFNRLALQAECLKTVTRQQVEDFFSKYFQYGSSDRSKLCVQCRGTTIASDNYTMGASDLSHLTDKFPVLKNDLPEDRLKNVPEGETVTEIEVTDDENEENEEKPKKRRKIQTVKFSIPSDGYTKTAVEIKDIAEYKSQVYLFPNPTPYICPQENGTDHNGVTDSTEVNNRAKL